MIRVHIDAKPDHVLRLAKRHDPLGAVAEMVWNALDAEANHVEVEIQTNDIGGVERVIVRDDGHGMPGPSCGSYFGDLGGSWKATAKVSPNLHRTLHGRSGQGRLRAYALGEHVRWTTVAKSLTGGHERTTITAEAGSPTDFQIDGPDPTQEPVGTVFDARVPAEHADRLNNEAALHGITAQFALFLTLHPEVSIIYRGDVLDPAHTQIHSAEYVLDLVDGGEPEQPSLRVIEWPNDPGRLLALCDRDGVLLGAAPVGIQAPGRHFTAYLRWDGFKEHLEDLALAELQDSILQTAIEAAREQLREHFRQRDEERRREQINQWKSEKIYPYDQDPQSATEAAERQVFDHVATTIARRLPSAQSGKKITLRLLRETIALDPDGLYPVLDELFHLSKADREDLKRLLDRTSLASLIRASTEVTNRLDFLAALKLMVFEPEVSGKVKERAELHRILEREQWIFGERYHLMVSDQSLNAVLKRHLEALGRSPAAMDLEPVVREDGSLGIVDLMLGQASRGSRGREHLVIELKAPRVRIGHKEVGQVKSYAQAVASDPQFADADVHWDFWVISTEMDDVIRKDASQPHEPAGRIANWGNVRVWAKTWAEIVDDCETRLHYYRDCLQHDPAAKHASDYLQRVHGQRTPKPLRQPAV
jgi:Histidine kinase-, DNA gyrase B-, and HSP90-like ATPase